MSMTDHTARVTAEKGAFAPLLRSGFRAHSLLFALVAVYYALDVYVLRSEPVGFFFTMLLSIAFGLVMIVFSVFVARFVRLAANERPDSPAKAIARDMWGLMSDRRRLAVGLPMVVVLAPFMTVFGEFKAAVPLLGGGFVWDQTFDQWDRLLHFGTLPWEWMQPVIGYWPITFVINFSYNFWFFAMWMVWAAWAFALRPCVDRTHFFLTFMLLWSIGGSAMAIGMASAGPAFYTNLGLAPDPYAPLMEYLRSADQYLPIWALGTQEMLWTGFNGRTVADGISAMPSMHNATSLLFVLTARHLGKWPFRLLLGHFIFVFIGSVHLGWHYAIDAYVGWALTLALWFTARPIAEWWDRQRPSEDLRQALDGYELALSPRGERVG